MPSPSCAANSERIAEAYLVHRLSEGQVEAFEEHYFACAECATVIQRVDAYVHATQAGARKLQSDPLRP